MKQRVKEFVLNDDGSVKCLKMVSGEEIVADEYVSAVPVDIMKRMMPKKWSTMPFFHQIQELEGIPVINIHLVVRPQAQERGPPLLLALAAALRLRRHVHHVQGVLRRGEVHARARLRAVLARWRAATPTGSPSPTRRSSTPRWWSSSDSFPLEIGPKSPDGVGAKLLKHAVVKTPRSVYAAIPGRNKYRPSQATPISNFTLAGDWTSQKFLGSMEGAVLAGKLAAEVVTDKAVYGASTKGLKKIVPDVIAEARALDAKEPEGVSGESNVSFGAGAVFEDSDEKELAALDPEQMVKTLEGAPAR